MSNSFENKPNSEALAEKAQEYVQKSIGEVLLDKDVVQAAIEEYDESSDAMWDKIEEHVMLDLLREHGVELSEKEQDQLHGAEHIDINDQDSIEKKAVLDKKEDMLNKLGMEYSGIDIKELIKKTIGAVGDETDIEKLRLE
jgi:hypothetical protein